MLSVATTDGQALAALLASYGLELVMLPPGEPIPGSYWGDSEAGLQGARLYARPDTPLHSVLHEASHYICMDDARRAGLDRDAGGDDPEECGVCYLQVLLAEALPAVGRERLLSDMDDWGYSFRLGSSRAWLETDAADALSWLCEHHVVDAHGRLTGALRR
jgi:hypothetical protein